NETDFNPGIPNGHTPRKRNGFQPGDSNGRTPRNETGFPRGNGYKHQKPPYGGGSYITINNNRLQIDHPFQLGEEFIFLTGRNRDVFLVAHDYSGAQPLYDLDDMVNIDQERFMYTVEAFI
ncbi:hypothetical protein SAMN05216311_11955, partial [Chitinophaga sp. CF418]